MLQQFAKLFKSNVVNGELSAKYKSVFGSEDGKAVLEDLLKFTKVTQISFTPNQPEMTAFNEGMKRVGLRLLSLTEADEPKLKHKKPLTHDEI